MEHRRTVGTRKFKENTIASVIEDGRCSDTGKLQQGAMQHAVDTSRQSTVDHGKEQGGKIEDA